MKTMAFVLIVSEVKNRFPPLHGVSRIGGTPCGSLFSALLLSMSLGTRASAVAVLVMGVPNHF